MSKFNLIFFINIVIVGCVPNQMTEQQLNSYVQDERNGLTKSTSSNGLTISLSYRPTDLLIAQEFATGEKTLQELRAKYDGQYYFVLSLSQGGREAIQALNKNTDQFGELVQTLSFRMGSVVMLTTNAGDSTQLADFVYNRTFGMGSSNEVLLVFDRSELLNSKWIQINMQEFGLGVGRQSFRFDCKELETVPRLVFSNMERI